MLVVVIVVVILLSIVVVVGNAFVIIHQQQKNHKKTLPTTLPPSSPTTTTTTTTTIIQYLEQLFVDAGQLPGNGSDGEDSMIIEQENVTGRFDLIFSSSVASLPIIGPILNGYLPNREVINFDFDNKLMHLKVETFPPFLPPFNIYGTNLNWDSNDTTISYTIKGKDKATEWKILYADESIVAAKSSVTGFNVIQRLS